MPGRAHLHGRITEQRQSQMLLERTDARVCLGKRRAVRGVRQRHRVAMMFLPRRSGGRRNGLAERMRLIVAARARLRSVR